MFPDVARRGFHTARDTRLHAHVCAGLFVCVVVCLCVYVPRAFYCRQRHDANARICGWKKERLPAIRHRFSAGIVPPPSLSLSCRVAAFSDPKDAIAVTGPLPEAQHKVRSAVSRRETPVRSTPPPRHPNDLSLLVKRNFGNNRKELRVGKVF